ncbi:hypothetical protein [Nesterenkonia pannonica]|nr:hypothetical protein [Nesterenkonia pannonica]
MLDEAVTQMEEHVPEQFEQIVSEAGPLMGCCSAHRSSRSSPLLSR